MAPDKTRQVGRPRDERLVVRRREQILDAALKVFASRCYRHTEVQEIADASAISKGSIYRYFPSKEALFLACVDRGMKRMQQHIDREVEGVEDPFERIAVAVRAHLAFFDAHPELIELLIQERAEFRDRKKPTYFEHRDANNGRWRTLLLELIQQGRVRDVPAERIMDVFSALLYGAIFTNYFQGRVKPVAAQADDLIDLMLHGMMSDAERARRS